MLDDILLELGLLGGIFNEILGDILDGVYMGVWCR
jgi:hypothetical protein